MFKSDINNTVKLLIPSFLRKPKVIAWLKVLISQVKSLMATFTAYRTDALFLLAHDSQVIYLEHYLNAKFNPKGNANDPNYEGNGIYISDAQPAAGTYLYNGFEQNPDTYLYNVSENGPDTNLYNSIEFSDRIGFIINVPTYFNIDDAELSDFVKKLRLAGKLVNIQNYTI
jgi:hypothetical protein